MLLLCVMKKSGRIFKDELTGTWFIIGLVFAVFAGGGNAGNES